MNCLSMVPLQSKRLFTHTLCPTAHGRELLVDASVDYRVSPIQGIPTPSGCLSCGVTSDEKELDSSQFSHGEACGLATSKGKTPGLNRHGRVTRNLIALGLTEKSAMSGRSDLIRPWL